ncbi:hypothetical protein PF003_g29610 [Phytophthora fragariae]|nr:hypothetical protein PF003_g29610 [Phytophthora fragariae]
MKSFLLVALTIGCLLGVGDTAGSASADDSEEITTPPAGTAASTSSPIATTATSTGLTCGTQLKNIYYHGFNLQTSTVSDAAACCDLCAAYDGCVLYTYFHSSSTGQSLCYLKDGSGEKTNYADSSSVTAVSAFMLEGVFYNDHTIYEFSTDSADECCAYCSQLAGDGCVLYTLYVSKSEGVKRCLLKSAAGTSTNYTTPDDLTVVSAFLPASATPTPTPAAECTVAEGQYCGNAQGATCCESGSYCQPWNTYYYQCIGLPDGCGSLETDVDYYGNDLSSAPTLYPWLCCSLCQETDGCNAYTDNGTVLAYPEPESGYPTKVLTEAEEAVKAEEISRQARLMLRPKSKSSSGDSELEEAGGTSSMDRKEGQRGQLGQLGQLD